MNERQHAQVHHVPGCAVVVAHQVEGHGNVGMAVIKAQIVLWQKKNEWTSTYYQISNNPEMCIIHKENHKSLTGLHLYSSDASCTALSHVAAPLPHTLSTSSFQYLQYYFKIKSMHSLKCVIYAPDNNPINVLTLWVYQTPCYPPGKNINNICDSMLEVFLWAGLAHENYSVCD